MFAGETTKATSSGKHVDLPQFFLSDPQIWFLEIENIFNYHGIKDEAVRYQHAIKCLPVEFVEDMENMLDISHEPQPYAQLKMTILDALETPKIKRLRRRFINLRIDSKKPSQILRIMRSLTAASDKLDCVVLRQLWLEKLPVNLRKILATSEEFATLDEEGAFADNFIEQYTRAIEEESLRSVWEQKSVEQVEDLEKDMSSLNISLNRRSRSRSLSLNRKKDLCYTRKSFSPEARRNVQHFL